MTFDTTSANSDDATASCICVHKKLKHAFFWSACRYHIGEVIVCHIFDDLKIKVSKSPDVALFKQFHENHRDFDHLERSKLVPYYLKKKSPNKKQC